jgi:hypothetical protein
MLLRPADAQNTALLAAMSIGRVAVGLEPRIWEDVRSTPGDPCQHVCRDQKTAATPSRNAHAEYSSIAVLWEGWANIGHAVGRVEPRARQAPSPPDAELDSHERTRKTRMRRKIGEELGRSLVPETAWQTSEQQLFSSPYSPLFVRLSRHFLLSEQETGECRTTTDCTTRPCIQCFIRRSKLGVRCSTFALVAANGCSTLFVSFVSFVSFVANQTAGSPGCRRDACGTRASPFCILTSSFCIPPPLAPPRMLTTLSLEPTNGD